MVVSCIMGNLQQLCGCGWISEHLPESFACHCVPAWRGGCCGSVQHIQHRDRPVYFEP